MNEIKVTIKHLSVSPKKLRERSAFFVGKGLDQSISILKLDPGRQAKILSGALKSARSSAVDRKLETEGLLVKAIRIDQAKSRRKAWPGYHGRPLMVGAKKSHLTIALTDRTENGTKS